MLSFEIMVILDWIFPFNVKPSRISHARQFLRNEEGHGYLMAVTGVYVAITGSMAVTGCAGNLPVGAT